MDRERDKIFVDEAYVTWPRLLLLLTALVAPLGSTAGYAMIMAFEARELAVAARPDPFTGTDAKRMEDKLIARDRDIMDQLRRELSTHAQHIEYALGEIREGIREMHAHASLGHKPTTSQRKN